MKRPTPQLARSRDLGWFRALGRYYRDPSASVFGKLIALVAIVYVVVPVDLIPDVPIVGWIDDLGVMGLATAWLLRVVARYRTPDTLVCSARSAQETTSRRSVSLPKAALPTTAAT
jgi:uncharacterized membrane protein YkvA (DUF1232 family)